MLNKKQMQEIAEQVVRHLFLDEDKDRPVERLMLVYGGENKRFTNPGWGRESVRDAIIEALKEQSA